MDCFAALAMTWLVSDSNVKQLSAVIVRLDRTIQYSRDGQRLSREAAGYWMPAFAGMTVERM